MKWLDLVWALLDHEDSALLNKLKSEGVMPYFSLSWVMTWVAHNITEWTLLLRVFDFFIAAHPLMPIYFVARLIMYRREKVIAMNEMPLIHTCLQAFPSMQELDVQFQAMEDLEVVNAVLAETYALFQKYPPNLLMRRVQSRLNAWSVVNRYAIDKSFILRPCCSREEFDEWRQQCRDLVDIVVDKMAKEPQIPRPILRRIAVGSAALVAVSAVAMYVLANVIDSNDQ
jgi:hypothetical protein